MTSTDDAPNQVAPLPTTDGLTAAYAAHDELPSTRPALRIGIWILLGLIVLNAALWLAYTSSRSVWGQGSEAAAQANIASEKITLTPTNTTANAVKTPAITNTSMPASTPTTALADVTENKASDKTSCMFWTFANSAEVKRADSRIAQQAWNGYTIDLIDEPPTYMAFIGPFASQAQTDAMLKSLVKLKIKDYSLLPSGSIALGVVATREAGQQLQQQLKNRGLKDVQLIERQGKGKLKRYRFEQMTPASLLALRQLSEGLGTLTACPKP